jgi:hypothetical protein
MITKTILLYYNNYYFTLITEHEINPSSYITIIHTIIFINLNNIKKLKALIIFILF